MNRLVLSPNTKFVLRGYDNNDYFKALYSHLKRRARKLLVETINQVGEQMNPVVVRDLLFILSDLDREPVNAVIERVEQAIATTHAGSSNTPHDLAIAGTWVRANRLALEFLIRLHALNTPSRKRRARRKYLSCT